MRVLAAQRAQTAERVEWESKQAVAQQLGSEISQGKKTWQRATAEGVGAVVGGALGAVGMGALGSVVPVVGTGVGVAVGGAGGSYLGGKVVAGLVNATNFIVGTNY